MRSVLPGEEFAGSAMVHGVLERKRQVGGERPDILLFSFANRRDLEWGWGRGLAKGAVTPHDSTETTREHSGRMDLGTRS